jgi:hypothetical protein
LMIRDLLEPVPLVRGQIVPGRLVIHDVTPPRRAILRGAPRKSTAPSDRTGAALSRVFSRNPNRGQTIKMSDNPKAPHGGRLTQALEIPTKQIRGSQ